MNEKQYLRANKRVFLAITIIFAYITLTMLAALAASHGDHFVRIMIQCLVSVGVIIISALGYLTRKKTHTCAIILTTAMMVGYAAVALLNTTEGTWAYALPLIIAAMVYLNERLMKIINSVFLLVNIVRLMLSFAPHASAALANKVLALFVLLLVAYASISITRMLVLFFDENMTEITEAADKQKKNHDQMLLVAENISRHFEEAMTVLDSLENSIEVSHSSIQEIADSTESTAEAIQKQAVMCSNIQGNTDAAEAGIHQMIEAAHETDATVKSGAQVVLELKEQAQNVEEASNITVQVIQSLTSKVEDVQSFVGSIIEISNQTNLLALNASIEAARAGEAGKGFAVVADEIRQLSEQTKNASANITEIIDKLNDDTKRANESIENSVASVEKQNELIENTREKFGNVGETVERLMEDIHTAEENIQKILDATNVISDNITHLSATGEEVAASSTEGLRMADSTVDNMKGCKKVLENIYMLAEDMKRIPVEHQKNSDNSVCQKARTLLHNVGFLMFTENTKVTGKRPCQGMPSGTTAHSHTGYLPVSPDAGHPLSSVSLQSFQNNWHPLPAGCQGFPHRHSRSAQNSGWHVSGCPFSRSSMPRSR